MGLGERLRTVRERLGMTQKEFAKFLNVGIATVQRYEREERIPSGEFLKLLLDKCNVNINWLLTGEGSMFVKSPHKEPSKETPTNQAGIDRELAQMLSMLSPEQQEGLKMLFRGYLKKPSSKPSASSSEKQKETVNLSNSHDENMVR
jgi:transcriptional regulator with XRE-family HTH domain